MTRKILSEKKKVNHPLLSKYNGKRLQIGESWNKIRECEKDNF